MDARRERKATPMIGESDAMRALRADIARLAPLPAPVVILGERGTEKELVARVLHDESPRREASYATTNCALLSRELARSELFGHERGAFTGAIGERKGLLREAEGGTVFLDEVGELPAEVQAGLRVLETGEVQPLGSRVERVTVRVVAATNLDLAGAFGRAALAGQRARAPPRAGSVDGLAGGRAAPARRLRHPDGTPLLAGPRVATAAPCASLDPSRRP